MLGCWAHGSFPCLPVRKVAGVFHEQTVSKAQLPGRRAGRGERPVLAKQRPEQTSLVGPPQSGHVSLFGL